jgi:hypothetical protein
VIHILWLLLRFCLFQLRDSSLLDILLEEDINKPKLQKYTMFIDTELYIKEAWKTQEYFKRGLNYGI